MAVEEIGLQTERSYRKPARITIVLLLALTGLILTAFLAISYLVPYYGFSRIYSQLPWIMGIIIGGLAAGVLLTFFLLVLATLVGHDVPFSRKLRAITSKALLPLLIVVGKLVGLRKEEVQHAFVAVNNELVLAQCRNGFTPHKVLLLMPHCLQDRDCTIKVTHRAQNCKRCGKCAIKGLLELAEKYGVDLAVATGGTFARRIVSETRPDLIIAVACERDLTSGIQDTIPLPVYGIFNERPFGPCLNTRVALDRVDAILAEVLHSKKATPAAD